ncbi:ATP-binding protein [Actinoplanes couchii]|uniref:histidine kinase n=1 Tax=Actinoplanes couchii TaxID=403638 RepID=A0ABQ3XSK3_9ACTN|nr:ATP-binding protein [Actinoplanes couchii]MDR6318570.1 signal transduction histidine kinase/PAS domain-containing protein [Actinoplanes couchii]GID61497.1 hypothetical protein Aco03nite_099010 [Actinoplanes couchii]
MQTTDDLDFQRLFEAAPVAMVVLDPELTIQQASDAYLAATNTTRHAILGRSLFDVFPDDPAEVTATGAADLHASLHRVIDDLVVDVMPIQRYAIRSAGEADRFETRFWAPTNAPVLNPDGSLAWILHRWDDVTAYVRERLDDPAQLDLAAGLALRHPEMEAQSVARHQLVTHNQALGAVLDSLDAIVIGCDDSGRTILHNQAARTLFALPEAATPDDRWQQQTELRDTGGRPLDADQHPARRILAGEHLRDVEILIRQPGRPVRHFLVNGRPVTLADRLTALFAMHEITLQRRAERLKQCELQVATILAKPEPADMIIANAVELVGSMLNWAAVEFWTIDDLGKVTRRQNCWHADESLAVPQQSQHTKGEGLAGRAWQRAEPIWVTDLTTDPITRDHSGRETLVSALAVPIPSGTAVLGTLIFYSDLHETPDDMRTAVLTGIAAHVGEFLERRRAARITTELERSRDEYISLVGHELRTPLTGIQSNAELLRTETDLTDDDRAQMLEVIDRRAHQLQDLVASLLDVAGTRAGHTALVVRRIDLAPLAHAAADTIRTSTSATIDVDTPPTVSIDADPDRLRDALGELLANAVTWAPGDSRIGVQVHAHQHSVTIAVSNTGPPIPTDNHERVFELFYRSDTLRHGGIPGTGLGLTLARAIIEQHHGTLTLSEPDEATTTFTIRLPRRSD